MDLRAGGSAVLADVNHAEALTRRLAELGLRSGQTIVLAQRGVGGSRVLAVGGARIAVDRATASQLLLVG